jgi:hypothetical protein
VTEQAAEEAALDEVAAAKSTVAYAVVGVLVVQLRGNAKSIEFPVYAIALA